MYQAHDVCIRKEDREKADAILDSHYQTGDIDDTQEVWETRDGVETITYHIHPYIYEDFEAIIQEFKQAGIQVF